MAARWRQARVGVAPSSSYIEFSGSDIGEDSKVAEAIRRLCNRVAMNVII